MKLQTRSCLASKQLVQHTRNLLVQGVSAVAAQSQDALPGCLQCQQTLERIWQDWRLPGLYGQFCCRMHRLSFLHIWHLLEAMLLTGQYSSE